MDKHRGHDTVSAAAEFLEKQKELGETQKKYQQGIQEREKKLQELRQTMETFTGSAQAAMGDSEKIFNTFIRSIERRRSKVKELMRDQEKAALSWAKEVQERLEQEIAELRKRDAELEQLLHTEDCIQFFQSFCALPEPCETSSISIVPILDFGMMQKVIAELEQRLKGFCSDEWLKFSRAVDVLQALGPMTREEFLQYSFSAAAEFLEKQKELGETQKKYQQGIQEREKKLQELRQTMETFTGSAQAAMGDSEKIFNIFIRSVERRRSKVKELMRGQEKAALSWAKEVQERLEQEIAELRKRDAELEQLLHTEDCVQFFQSFCALPEPCETSSISIVPILDFGMMQKVIAELEQRLKGFCSDEWLKFSRAVDTLHTTNSSTETMSTQLDVLQAPGPTTREEFLQYSCKLTLDFNTAHNYLQQCNNDPNWVIILPGLVVLEAENYPDHPERFEHMQQILCRQGLSGRCYWEVKWYGTHVTYIAVSYKGIDRKGEGRGSHFMHSDKSWCLKCTINSYTVWHDNVGTAIYPPKDKSSTIGVYLDHKAGTLSFYCVSDTMILLHRFQTKFTEPLYPGIGGWGIGDQVRICSLQREQ
ncbi:hypothetical protein AAFF_G00274840 [Aldrovandia affinis]|uniref:B30.2/SPRY domain-containing protein n=1 Tax=Aldrovandia affinis TaxID=143900 RepID=A0AAD7SRQ7_9TELE|nr:hypothetical protein AAFF_G00274840 [Aldrovandia affinis]